MPSNTDFETIAAEAGRTVTWYANTEVTSAQTGERVASYDGGTSIKLIVNAVTKNKKWAPQGYLPDFHIVGWVSSDYAVSENDKFTINSVDYQVMDVDKTAEYAGALVFTKLLLREIATEAS